MNSVAISLAGVSVWYDESRPVLSEIDLTVETGAHLALLGPNGVGKSTVLSLMGARRFPSLGTVTILGRQLGRVDLRELRAQIGAVDAAARIPAAMNVVSYVATGLTETVQLLRPSFVTDAVRHQAEVAMSRVSLDGFSDRTVATLSAGERARARLARAVIGDPELLLLDEPATGLDLPGRADLLDALESLANQRKSLTTVLVAHHLEELPSTTTRVAMLRDDGGGSRLIAFGGVDLLTDGVSLQRCFGRPLVTAELGGRWVAVARSGR